MCESYQCNHIRLHISYFMHKSTSQLCSAADFLDSCCCATLRPLGANLSEIDSLERMAAAAAKRS
jgi:hypothetical protein